MLKNNMQDNFTQISNEIVTNEKVSHGALRVYLYLLSKPSGWNVFNKDIQNQLHIKQAQTLSNYWKELEAENYIERVKVLAGSKDAEKYKAGSYIYSLLWKNHNMENPKEGKIHTHSNTNLISNKEVSKGTDSNGILSKDELLEQWNENAKAVGLPKMIVMTDERYNKFKTRLKHNPNFLEHLSECLNMTNDYLRGVNWYTFDWLVHDNTNYVKVLEGKYIQSKGVKQ